MERAGAGSGPALLFCLMLAMPLAAWGQPGDPLTHFPVEATGEIHFMADGAVFLDAAKSEVIRFYLAVPEEDVRCVSVEGRTGDWMQFGASMRLLDSAGQPLYSLTTEVEVPCGGIEKQAAFARRVVTLTAPLHMDPTGIELELHDRNGVRQDMISRIREINTGGIARGHLRRPVMRDDWGVSSPIFLWDAGEAQAPRGRSLLRSAHEAGENLNPNPGRNYGLFQPVVSIYFEIYGLKHKDVTLRTRVMTIPDGERLFDASERVKPRWDRCAVTRELDAARLPAGTYEIEIEVIPPEDLGPSATVTGPFQVIWDAESWRMSRAERMQEASLLLNDQLWLRFMEMAPGQQEAVLESLWVSAGGSDAAPEVNRLKALFRERVGIADRRFGGVRRGSLTDRGKVFVHFGLPDEIHKELAPQEEDFIFYFLQREIEEPEAEEAGGRPLRHPMDTAPYEVWYYVNRGVPLVEEWIGPSRSGSLRFIFVDEMGNGIYSLIYTNLFGGFK